MVIFITASLISGVIIYKYIFNPDWSDNRRNEYKVELKSTKAPFNEGKFDKIIMKIRERNSSKDSQLLIPRDLFEGDLE
jgi:predicted HNH restriction endonuclease